MTGRIVVGVDGSGNSRVALEWAVSEAKLRGARVEAIMVLPPSPVFSGLLMPPYADLERSANAALDAVMAELGLSSEGEPRVNAHVEAGPVAPVLLAAAKDADLLVVGARGYGEFAGMLVGSVSLHCVTHARCPVVVVRTSRGANQSP